MIDEAVTLYRCTECGKWSHAKKQPKQHQRWHNTGAEVIADQEWDTGAWVDFEVPKGEFRSCGPFEPWVAVHLPEEPR